MSEQAFLENYFQSSTKMNLTCSSDILNFKAVSQESRSQNEPRCQKTGFLHICENKDADQLRSDREADQRLCFSYTDSTIPLLP